MRRLRNVRAAFALLTSLFATLAPVSGAAPSAADALGDWQGTLDTGKGSLHIVFHLAQDKDGKLTGTMDSPDQNASGIVLTSVTFTSPDVHLGIEMIQGAYDGKLDNEKHQIVGVWKQGPASLPLTLSRPASKSPR